MLNSVVIICCIVFSLCTVGFYDFVQHFWFHYMEERDRLKTHDWVQDQCNNPVHKKHLKRLAVECDHITLDKNIWNVAWELSKDRLPWWYQWVHVVLVLVMVGLVFVFVVYRKKMRRVYTGMF